MAQALLGILSSLDTLFEDYTFSLDQPENHHLLSGLPGTVRKGAFAFVKLRPGVREAVASRCTEGAIGGFRAVRSERWMKQGLLPVFAHDLPHIAHVLVALVPYAEHGRFEGSRHAHE